VQGNARVVLVDLREGFSHRRAHSDRDPGEHAPKMVAIPPFVGHGYQGAGPPRRHPQTTTSPKPYDPESPDEGRIAWNDPRIGFDWSIENI